MSDSRGNSLVFHSKSAGARKKKAEGLLCRQRHNRPSALPIFAEVFASENFSKDYQEGAPAILQKVEHSTSHHSHNHERQKLVNPK
ncbi:MAG TPA: hypothetical protein VIM75_21390 [Ohtaekwangia sp.]